MQYLTLVNSQLNGVLNFNGQTSPYINVIAGLTELLHYRLAETGSWLPTGWAVILAN